MLEVKNLKKSFDNNKVFKGIDFKVNKGDIVEHGNRDELLAQGGFYADLYNSQFSEEEE